MAWSKNWKTKARNSSVRRAPYRARSNWRALNRKAPKRFNWIEVLDTTCSAAFLPPHICGEDDAENDRPLNMDCVTGVLDVTNPINPTRIVLVPPAAPAQTAADAYQSDDITVVRLVGHILLMPLWFMTEEALTAYNAVPSQVQAAFLNNLLAQRHYWVRAGKKKETMILDPVIRDYVWPRRDPLDSLEWVDGKYSRQWEYEKMVGELGTASSAILQDGSQMGCCGVVTGGGQVAHTITVDTIAVLGTGGAANVNNIPAITANSTECVPCVMDPDVGQFHAGINLAQTRPIRMNVSSRQRVRLSESEGLAITINYSTVDYTANAFNSCFPDITHLLGVGFMARPHIKALIET